MKKQTKQALVRVGFSLLAAMPMMFAASCSEQAEAPQDAIRPDQLQTSKGPLTEGAQPGRWTQDLEAAKELAAEMNLPLFLNFTGSDWCPPCKMMHERVFSDPNWNTYAGARLILVHIDFPTDLSLVPEEYRDRNKELQAKWQVQAYPTFVILDPTGKKELGRLGATQELTTERFVKRVDAILAGESIAQPGTPVSLPVTDVTPRVGAGHKIDPVQQGAQLGRWTEDLDAAKELAAETERPMLFFFTGSDWCQACTVAKQRILSRANFQRYAKNNLVQVVIDFPRQKELPPAVAERNQKLAEKHHVVAFPTFLLFAPDGETLAGVVPMADSPHQFRENIEAVANMLPGEVEATATALGDGAGSRYRKLMTDLAKVRREHRVLMNEARRLQAVGGLTPEFRDNLEASAEKLTALEIETSQLRDQVFAAKLPPLIAEKYLRLKGELTTATNNYREWLRSNPGGTPEEQAAKQLEYQLTINKVMTVIDDIEAEYLMKVMGEADAEEYRRLRERLAKLRESFQAWLQTNPANSPENNQKYGQFMQQMQKLQDELDALRDGV